MSSILDDDPGMTPDEDNEQRSLADYVEEAYRNYAVYVIHDRALPHIGDGLKPVQRRIVHAMGELGLRPTSKPKKSMRTVGDVVGKYHPHGDAACYEAMVLLAQPFSTRYPLVEGQGNFGSPDEPKSFAAARYTEARLTAFAQEVLLSELGQDTVDFVANYDATMTEPEVLPARVPLLLCNGVTGIAVGMATDMPPHNLREVVGACITLLEKKSTPVEELTDHILGPDFPTSAKIITSREELREMYATGRGSVRARAIWEEEDGEIIVSALPYQVSGSKVHAQIADQMRAKKLPLVNDVRDDSGYGRPQRLVIVPKSRNVDRQQLMMHLFATTDLERSYRVNFNVLGLRQLRDEDGKPLGKAMSAGNPRVFGLREMLLEWLDFRRQATRRRFQYELRRVTARLEKLAAWLIAHLNIDEVIRIIRENDEPKPVLIEAFDITPAQAEAILELKLRNLRKLDEMAIRKEEAELEKEKRRLETILGSERRLTTEMKKELNRIAEEFGDDRRSPIDAEVEAASAFDETDLISSEPITVVLSEQGWARAGKGHALDVSRLTYKGSDTFLDSALGRSTNQAAFLDSTGRSYSLPAHKLPSARGAGEPLTSHFTPPSGARFVACLCGEPTELYLMASDAGYGFVVQLEDLFGRNKAGKRVLTVPKGCAPVMPTAVLHEDAVVVAASSAGRLLAYPVAELPRLAKGKGNKLIGIRGKERMIGVVALGPKDQLLVHAGKRYLRMKVADVEEYRGARGLRGTFVPKGYRKIDRLEIERHVRGSTVETGALDEGALEEAADGATDSASPPPPPAGELFDD